MTKGWEFITHVLWVLAYPPIISVNNIRQKKTLSYCIIMQFYMVICLYVCLSLCNLSVYLVSLLSCLTCNMLIQDTSVMQWHILYSTEKGIRLVALFLSQLIAYQHLLNISSFLSVDAISGISISWLQKCIVLEQSS